MVSTPIRLQKSIVRRKPSLFRKSMSFTSFFVALMPHIHRSAHIIFRSRFTFPSGSGRLAGRSDAEGTPGFGRGALL